MPWNIDKKKSADEIFLFYKAVDSRYKRFRLSVSKILWKANHFLSARENVIFFDPYSPSHSTSFFEGFYLSYPFNIWDMMAQQLMFFFKL